MSYVSNLQLDDVRRRERAEFAASIREAAGSPALAVVRVTPHRTAAGTTFHNVQAWTYNFAPLVLDIAQQLAVARLLIGRRPDIDWTVPAGHEYRLDAAMLRRAPVDGEIGHRPPLHRVFGGADPVFLPRTVPAQRTRSEAA